MIATAATPILARIPESLLAQVNTGVAERVGMVVRDTATKKIIAHLQETGVTQSIAGKLFGAVGGLVPDPVSAVTGIGTLIQNEQIKGRLDVMTAMMGGMQAMQTATLITSVAGIGVTAASTAMILKRLTRIDRSLARIEGKFEEAQQRREDWDLHHSLKKVAGQLQRMEEARLARDPEAEVRNSERALHEAFGALEVGISHVGQRQSINPDFLGQLFAALSLCGSVQIKALIWLDEKDRAAERAKVLFTDYQKLSTALPQDRLLERFAGVDEAAESVAGMMAEVRRRMATVPSLAETLIGYDMHGRDYLERAESEEQEPLLMLAAP